MSLEEFVLPSQVGDAADMAEELFRKMYPTGEEEVDESEETYSDESDEEDDDEESTSEDEEDAEDEDDEPEIDPKELKKWRDRYLTLKGKYDAEVPRLASQVKELMEKVSTSPSTKTADVQAEVQDEVNQFESIYGQDFAQQLRKVIDDAVQAKLTPVVEQVISVEDVQRQAAADSFKSYLEEAAPGWEELWEGKDKGFVKFLSQKDPMGLNTYGTYLTKFNEEWDADGMAKIFNIYKESKSKPSLSKEQEAMIAPSRAKATSTPASNDKRIWTTDTIKQFEIEDRQGKYSDEDSQKLWADLLSAPQEGRVR